MSRPLTGNHESGRLESSETSADMRDLLARETEGVRAAEAGALFCYRAKQWLGASAAAFGGRDTLVFSAGIGENCPSIRSRTHRFQCVSPKDSARSPYPLAVHL